VPSALNGALKAARGAAEPAAMQLAKVGVGATPRGCEKNDNAKEADIVKRLQAICTDADPTRLYRNLVKIGQGYVRARSRRVAQC
jgi:p21-activated kinase 1